MLGQCMRQERAYLLAAEVQEAWATTMLNLPASLLDQQVSTCPKPPAEHSVFKDILSFHADIILLSRL